MAVEPPPVPEISVVIAHLNQPELLGRCLAALAAQAIMRSAPKFLIVLEPRAVLVTVVSGLLMGMLAALLPARRAATLDPAQVFRK